MDIGEAAGIAGVQQEFPQCNPPDVVTYEWTVVLDDIKGEGDATTLKNNMIGAGASQPGAPPLLALGPDLFACSPGAFPVQTHHLIPEKQIPKHKVTAWLTDSPKTECRHPKYVLSNDTPYDTNGAANDYFMPYASSTHQWNKKLSKQNAVAFEMMRRTRIQLHQGRHSMSADYLEELVDVETAPYKAQVEEFLDEIDRLVFEHVDTCDQCRDNSKTKVQPLLSTVRMVEQASRLMKVLIDRCHVAVSARAGAYATLYCKDGVLHHPSQAFVHPSDFE